MVFSFLFFLILFCGIGLLAAYAKKNNVEDYLVSSRQTHPWSMALSAASTACSGFMFMGLIGMAYTNGLGALWFWPGLTIGNVISLSLTFQRLNKKSIDENHITIPSVLAFFNGSESRVIRILCALIVIIFLGSYAAAQLTASGKALTVIFEVDYAIGTVASAIIVLLYCYAGGIRASIWTDTAQSIVMFIVMLALVGMGLYHVGGLLALVDQLRTIDPAWVCITWVDCLHWSIN